MTAVAKFVTDAKDLIEKVFLKTSFLIVLVSLFLFSQWVDGEIKYLPFIEHFHSKCTEKTPNHYTTYTVTLAMLLLLSRGLSFLWEFFDKRFNISELWAKNKENWSGQKKTEHQKRMGELHSIIAEKEKKIQDKEKEIKDIDYAHTNQNELNQNIVNTLLQSKSAYNFLELLHQEGITLHCTPHFKGGRDIKCAFRKNGGYAKIECFMYYKAAPRFFRVTKAPRFFRVTTDIESLLEAYKDHQEELTFAQL